MRTVFWMTLIAAAVCLSAAYGQERGSLEQGRELYRVYCTQCHGIQGNGWGINAPHMEVLPRNHSDPVEMGARTDDDLFRVIKEGGAAINKSVLMPNWDGNLSDDDIWSLVRYLRELCCNGKSVQTAKAAPKAGPATTKTDLTTVCVGCNSPVANVNYSPDAHLPTERLAPQAPLRKFEMTIEEVELQIAPGFRAKVWAFNGQVPGPLIHVRQGDEVQVTVTNNTTLNHTVHWHGVYQTNTWRSDGVPNVTQMPIEPGNSYVYQFVADKPGSLWYHCHVNVPEHVGLRGMWGPLVVDPAEPTELEKQVTKDAVLMFSAWNSEVAMEYGTGGHPREVYDYFSINGKAFPMTQPLRVKKLDVLRLRLYSVSSETSFHLHGHDVLVTHKDGIPLESPYYADVVDVPIGSRIDVIVRMYNPGRWIAHDHIEHHVSNNGVEPGGAVLVVEYDGVPRDDPWYVWHDLPNYAPDFFMSETLGKEYGLYNIEAFRGQFPPSTPVLKQKPAD